MFSQAVYVDARNSESRGRRFRYGFSKETRVQFVIPTPPHPLELNVFM